MHIIKKTWQLDLISLLIILLTILITAPSLSAQSNVSFKALSDAKEVLENNYFEITFNLKNANGTEFTPPDFSNFNVLSGPNSSSSMQIINGQVSRDMGYSYSLQGIKAGSFTIGSATIKANGKILKSNPLLVKVVKADGVSDNNSDDKQAYVIIQPNKTTAYPGEQILLDFKLYTTVPLDGYDIAEEPDYRGFFVQELRRFNSRTQREVINGKQVTTKILRRLALFPQQTGELVIPSARIQLAIIEDNNRTGFFFSRNIKPVFITTDPITIKVKELPSDFPDDFTGAVGNYEFLASTNRIQVSTDDAVSISMMISGNGDMKRVQPPLLLLSDSFEIYPPKIVEENITEEQGALFSRKIIEYLILPKYPGQFAIKPTFSYFNPSSATFETLETGPYSLMVKQGTDRHVNQPKVFDNAAASNDINFIKMETSLKKKSRYFVGSPTFWGITSLPILALIGLLFFKKARSKNHYHELSLQKGKLAKTVAQQRFSIANTFLQSASCRPFYDEISKASLGYVCDKLNIPLSQLSKDNVRDKLKSLGVNQLLIGDFMDIIHTCEMALFAAMDNSQDMQNTYDKAIKTIKGMEEEIVENDRR